jgi:cell division protein FtsL
MGRSRLFLVIAAFCVGLGLFKVKYQVMALEKRHKDILKSVSENRESIHVLKAELTHLNDPERLQKLAENHLGFSPVKPHQIVAISELPKKNQQAQKEMPKDPVDKMMDFLDANKSFDAETINPNVSKKSQIKSSGKVAINVAA